MIISEMRKTTKISPYHWIMFTTVNESFFHNIVKEIDRIFIGIIKTVM